MIKGDEQQVDEHNVVRIGRRAMPWFEAAFRSHALGYRINWDMVFGTGQADNGQMAPIFLVYAEMPAIQLDRVPHALFASLGTLGMTEEIVDKAVAQIVEKLHEARRAEMAAVANVVNGHGGVS